MRYTTSVAVLVSLVGLFLLYYASVNVEPTRVWISNITRDIAGNSIFVCGNITSKRVSNNHIFMDITDETSAIRFIVFNSSLKTLDSFGLGQENFTVKKQICAYGLVDEYPKGTGNMELVYRGGNIAVH